LRDAGFRATQQRTAFVSRLAAVHEPQSIQELADALSGTCDPVTVYRMITAFEKAGLVRESTIGGRPHYELAEAGDDHHHLVCTNCRAVEDFVGCGADAVARAALKRSRRFTSVTSHSFDLYGLCRSCTA
jgi:Fur family ferric uptake transcriptional regulator